MADQRTEHLERTETSHTIDPDQDRVTTEQTTKEKTSQGSAQGSMQQPKQGTGQDTERTER